MLIPTVGNHIPEVVIFAGIDKEAAAGFRQLCGAAVSKGTQAGVMAARRAQLTQTHQRPHCTHHTTLVSRKNDVADPYPDLNNVSETGLGGSAAGFI